MTVYTRKLYSRVVDQNGHNVFVLSLTHKDIPKQPHIKGRLFTYAVHLRTMDLNFPLTDIDTYFFKNGLHVTDRLK